MRGLTDNAWAHLGLTGIQVLVGVMLAFAWSSGSGCVAVNFGKPEVFRNTETLLEADSRPSRTVVESARVQLRQSGKKAEVSIYADIREEFDWRRVEWTTTVRKQKRLAFGLFPGAAETLLMPDGVLASAMTVPRASYNLQPSYKAYYANARPELKWYAGAQVYFLMESCGILQAVETVWALVITPFRGWACDNHDFLDLDHYRLDVREDGKLVGDASESPKLKALYRFPKEVREQIGVLTCFDEGPILTEAVGTHLALFGFHKYLAVSVEVPEDGEAPEVARGVETTRRLAEVGGPYEAELSIPGLGYSERKEVPPGCHGAVFALPAVTRDGRYEANVMIRDCSRIGTGKAADVTRKAIWNLTGQANRFELELRAPEALHRIGKGTGRTAVLSGTRHSYEIMDIKSSRSGRYSVHVKIVDPARRNEAIQDVETDVRRRIREDFAGRHPGMRIDEIHEGVAVVAAGENGDVLTFEGWAFAARALAEGWNYDEKTRRGEIWIWVSEGVSREEAERWATENLGAIVADKTVAMETGESPSPGAAFRCTGKRFENGILRIEFEVAE